MGRLGKSLTMSGIIVFWLMCFVYGFGVLYTAATHGDVIGYFFQCIIMGFVFWIAGAFILYDIYKGADERDEQRRKELEEQERTKDKDDPNKK